MTQRKYFNVVCPSVCPIARLSQCALADDTCVPWNTLKMNTSKSFHLNWLAGERVKAYLQWRVRKLQVIVPLWLETALCTEAVVSEWRPRLSVTETLSGNFLGRRTFCFWKYVQPLANILEPSVSEYWLFTDTFSFYIAGRICRTLD